VGAEAATKSRTGLPCFLKKEIEMKKALFARLAIISVAAASGSAFAVGPDLSQLTGSIDVGTTVTAVLAVASSIAVLFLAIRGAKTVLSMIRG
jgi:hypothetical protein